MLNTIGSDMECFAVNKAGLHIALCDKIGGTKEDPKPLEHLPNGFFIQEDNVAFEFNIPVCRNAEGFIDSFKIMRNEVKTILATLNLDISTNASVSFDNTELTHPKALVFGCEPDYNAWSMEENPKPHSDNKNLRTAGGHIHIGTSIDMITGVRNMDLFLGIPSVLIDDTPHAKERRKLYGKAGAMRPKSYGFEYRSLSNFWMFSDEMVNWVFEQSKLACKYERELTVNEGKMIQRCINTNDKELAKKICEKYSINYTNFKLPEKPNFRTDYTNPYDPVTREKEYKTYEKKVADMLGIPIEELLPSKSKYTKTDWSITKVPQHSDFSEFMQAYNSYIPPNIASMLVDEQITHHHEEIVNDHEEGEQEHENG